MYFPKLKLGAGLAGVTLAAGLVVSTPAQAVITPFASFKAINSSANVVWTNSAGAAGTGTGGTFSSKANSGASTLVTFSFSDPALSSIINNITAKLTLTSSVSNSPATVVGRNQKEAGLGGTISFTSLSTITLYGHTFAAGSNLLTVTFTGASLLGSSANTSFSAATSTGTATITYSSDFLTFLPTVDKDFALALTSISPSLTHSTGAALKNFTAVATGNFSSDPAPIPSFPVPESATWAMFIAGFGLMGATLRRRRPEHSLV